MLSGPVPGQGPYTPPPQGGTAQVHGFSRSCGGWSRKLTDLDLKLLAQEAWDLQAVSEYHFNAAPRPSLEDRGLLGAWLRLLSKLLSALSLEFTTAAPAHQEPTSDGPG